MPKSWRKNRNLCFIETPAGEPAGGGAASTTEPPEPAKGDEALGAPGLKALQAERDAREAAEKKAQDLEKQIEDSKKSTEQKAADDLLAAQKQASDSAATVLKYKAAEACGLPLAAAERLSGTTLDELKADAENLKSLLGNGKAPAPKPDPSAGGGGAGGGSGDDAAGSVSAGRDLYAERRGPKK